MDLKSYLSARAAETDAALDAFLPAADERPATIHGAMRYCVFAGGKRLRPVLCLAAAVLLGYIIPGHMLRAKFGHETV